jgi:transposase
VFEHFSSVASAKESLKAKRQKGHSVPNQPEMQRKNRDDASQHVTITVNGRKPSVKWTNEGFVFWKATGFGLLKPCRKKEMNKLTKQNNGNSECKMSATLKYERPGHYYMIIPIIVKKKNKSDEATDIIAFDPGVRTFQVGFDNTGRVIEYRKSNDNTTKGGVFQIYKLGLMIDRLKSKIDRHKKERYKDKKERERYKNHRKKIRRRCGHLEYRISNLKRDLHWKMAKEITENYTDVLISRFPVSQMVKKEERRIQKVTVRKMMNWSHYLFR